MYFKKSDVENSQSEQVVVSVRTDEGILATLLTIYFLHDVDRHYWTDFINTSKLLGLDNLS